MTSSVVEVFLPVALVLVMFGLGLSLTVADFVRVGRYPKAAVLALGCQLVLLPALCLGLVLLFRLDPLLSVGMMLLAAAPGGTTANLYSHLAGGDVALNITLTAINTVLAVVWVPLIVGWSVQGFLDDRTDITLPPMKLVEVFAIVLVPVAIGMALRRRFPRWADRMARPGKIASAVVLALAIVAAIAQEHRTLLDNLGPLVGVALVLSTAGLALGYYLPRMFGVGHRQCVASANEVGIQNAVLAITIAITVLGDKQLAVPAAFYGVLMFVPATVACYLMAGRARRSDAAVTA